MSDLPIHGQPVLLFAEVCERGAQSEENRDTILNVRIHLGDLLLVAGGIGENGGWSDGLSHGGGALLRAFGRPAPRLSGRGCAPRSRRARQRKHSRRGARLRLAAPRHGRLGGGGPAARRRRNHLRLDRPPGRLPGLPVARQPPAAHHLRPLRRTGIAQLQGHYPEWRRSAIPRPGC